MAKLFRRRIEHRCAYCARGVMLDEDTVLCAKKGTRAPVTRCRSFCYDPCKRIPPRAKAPDFEKYSECDYSL